MFVLILLAFVTAAAGEHQSCNEYCNSLKSSQPATTGRSECNCHPQHTDQSDKSRNLGNPIYYEPVEFHPLPDISFVYQPFVISNPTSSSDDKDTTRSLSSQETEHHRKYKRKDNVIHKISIDSSKHPLYLDIDIKKSPDRSRSSQNHIDEFDDLQITEQDLKDCIDLHLLFHLRRNESDNLKFNWNVEHLEKYFHISDADLMMELDKKCKQPSDVVEQSLRHIKNGMSVMKPQYSNYSDIDTHDNVTHINDTSKSFSNEVPHVIPINNLYNNMTKEARHKSNANAFNNEKFIIPVQKEIIKLNHTLPTVVPKNFEFDKLAEYDRNESNAKNKSSKYFNSTQSLQGDTNYRAVFDNSQLEHQDPIKSRIPDKTTETASTANLLTFFTLDNKNDKKMEEETVSNGEDFLRMAPTSAIITPQSREDNHSEKFTNNENEMFVTTSRNYLANTAFVTLHESNLNNGLDIENPSIRHDIIHTSTFKNENENDLEQSSSNMNYVLIKNTDYFPEVTTNNILNKPKENSRSNEHLLVNTDRNMYIYDPYAIESKTHFNDNFSVENELTTLRSIMVAPSSDLIYSENNVTLLTTTEVNESNNITTYMNRTIIPQSKLQIPRIVVTEFSNETVDSIVDGTEEMPNDNYVGIKTFEMDVADLTSPKVKSIEVEQNSIKNSEHNEKLKIHDNVKEAEEGLKSSNITEISGNLYFMFKKLLIPMRFIQAPNGELKLILDGASFCKNLLTGANGNNGILLTLCNSAVHDKNHCRKTSDKPKIDVLDIA